MATGPTFGVAVNDHGLAASLSRANDAIQAEASREVRRHGQMLVTRIKGKASGRPGPRAPTGDYRRSWGMEFAATNLHAVARVGTNAPQGRRLEFGFVGVDSLGRHYNQPPFPHVGPAVDSIEPQFVAAIEGIVTRWTIGGIP